jgi:hypothetical protein
MKFFTMQNYSNCISRNDIIQLRGFFALLLIGVSAIFLDGCIKSYNPSKIALTTTDCTKGIAAVEYMTDQAVLEQVAQDALCSDVRQSAVEKLTNQNVIAKIAITDSVFSVISKAIDKLSDPTLLAGIAFDKTSWLAFSRLNNAEILKTMSAERKDKNVQLIYKFIRAFDYIPLKHRERFLNDLFPVICILNDPDVTAKIGEIENIVAVWTPVSEHYRATTPESDQYYTGPEKTVNGEKIKFTITVRKSNNIYSLSHTWLSVFPNSVYTVDYVDAEVNGGDLLFPVFEKLSQQELIKLTGKVYDQNILVAAIRKISDEDVLKKFANQSPYRMECVEAHKRLDEINSLKIK